MKTARNWKQRTVVITGASSGLGRATALAFARRGARLGLIARNEEGLRSLALDARAQGAEAAYLATDVTDAGAVSDAARQIASRFGGIDVWINNASVAIYGEADKIPLEEAHRLMDVNFFGYVHGARAALPFLERSPGGGTLLNVLSLLAEASLPLQSMYAASKHATYGFFQCLREELIHRRSRVKIGNLFAPPLATPFFDHARTYMGYRPKPVPPVYPPEHYAELLVRQAGDPDFDIVVGGFPRAALAIFRWLPGLARAWLGRTGYLAQRTPWPKGVTDGDNLFKPMPELASVRGSTHATRGLLESERALKTAALAGMGAALLAVASRGSGARAPVKRVSGET